MAKNVSPQSRAPKVLVLVGPTATGKTALAVELCERIGGEIVGADSVQVYRGLDIGSAKATAESLRSIRHHMTDIVDPDESIDAASYAHRAERVIAQIHARGAIAVVVGGTGLWIRALLRGLVQLPRVDRELRERLERQWRELGPALMHDKLAQVDPRSASRIHPNDRIRVVRALEVFEQCGLPAGELRDAHALGSKRFDTLTIMVKIASADLDERLKRRARVMIEAGWAQEVRALVEKYGADIRSLHSVGYHQMVQHVSYAVPLEETEQAIIRATRQYARRQRTWFQSDPDVDLVVEPSLVLGREILERIRAFLGRTETTTAP
jgi:tRNA dimethylallyltransferase